MVSELMTERIRVKNRILGLLIRDAREKADRKKEDCAELIGINPEAYENMEMGRQAPSLPQMELLARYFNIPLSKLFMTDTIFGEKEEEPGLKAQSSEILMIRQRLIGIKIQELRKETKLSISDVAEKTGLTEEQIQSVERGQKTLPVNELEILVHAVKGNLSDLFDFHGSVGGTLGQMEEFEKFKKLPEEMRAFILNASNMSYLDVAVKLSKTEVQRLRAIAEAILEITF